MASKEYHREKAAEWRAANKERHADYHRKWVQKKHRKMRQEIIEMLGGCCVQCGYKENHLGLELDHIDGGGRNQRKGKSPIQYYREVMYNKGEGLQVLCGTCHAIKTRTENLPPGLDMTC